MALIEKYSILQRVGKELQVTFSEDTNLESLGFGELVVNKIILNPALVSEVKTQRLSNLTRIFQGEYARLLGDTRENQNEDTARTLDHISRMLGEITRIGTAYWQGAEDRKDETVPKT